MDRDVVFQDLYGALCYLGAGTPPEEQWQDFQAGGRLRTLEKGDFWVGPGDTPASIGYVINGFFRMFYQREDGRALTKSFVGEHGFLAAYETLLNGGENRLLIQSLEHAEIIEFEFRFVRSFFERDMFWQRLGRRMAEYLYVKKARREAALLMDSAASRYHEFLKSHSSFADRIPDYHIASYLGITPERLSRLKKQRVRVS